MPVIEINGKNHSYDDTQVIEFTEGLIGLPRLRRAALIEASDHAPFFWLASVEDNTVRFIVVDPKEIYPDYEAKTGGIRSGENSLLAIVKISSDWQKTTVNLRAPIFVDRKTGRGEQVILTESNYKLEEALPLN